jgi:glycosidase
MVMTDRFRNGDPSNDVALAAAPGAGFLGGDLEGLRAALEEGYFDDLGVNALWLSPFNANPAGLYDDAGGSLGVSGYHGYWPVDPLAVDWRIGGGEALTAVVQAAHARGIRVLMDLVVNHVHEEHPYVAAHPEWFNDGCLCGADGCDWTERRLDCLFRPYMPDVDWRNRAASEQLVADALAWWLDTYDLDGFRIDAVKHVDDAAILNLGVRVREAFGQAGTRYFLMGETAMGWDASSGPATGGNIENYDTISRYIGPDALDGQFDFVLYYAGALQFLNDDPGRGMAHIDYWSQASMARYPEAAVMTPYIGSHDSARFITLAAHPWLAGHKWADLPPAPAEALPYDRMYTAFGWLFALPGAPLLYYGDEYGQWGGADPNNRRMWRPEAQLTAAEASTLAHIRKLGAARRDLPALQRGAYVPLDVDEDTLVFGRLLAPGDAAIVALTPRRRAPAAQRRRQRARPQVPDNPRRRARRPRRRRLRLRQDQRHDPREGCARARPQVARDHPRNRAARPRSPTLSPVMRAADPRDPITSTRPRRIRGQGLIRRCRRDSSSHSAR